MNDQPDSNLPKRDRLTAMLSDSTRPHLEDGERIGGIFHGNTQRVSWAFAAVILVLLTNLLLDSAVGTIVLCLVLGVYVLTSEVRVVAVTNRNVVVLRGGKISPRSREVISRLPLDTEFGPPSGLLEYELQLGDETVHVYRPNWKRVELAEAARSAES